jgi:radical SAM protein with 4Fe4S-binding SPASM domain
MPDTVRFSMSLKETMREDPFQKEYKRWNSGTNAEKYANMRQFPEAVEIELTNTCNLGCRFCPTGVRNTNRVKGIEDAGRPQGFMDEFTYLKIIGEVKDYDCHIRYARFGEPTLHPKFWKFVKMANDLGIKISLITNGTNLRQLRENIDSIKLSIHARSNRVLEGILALETMNTFRHVSITSNEIEDLGMHDFDFEKLNVDKVSKYQTLTKDKKFHKRLPNCPDAMHKVSINWNGDVSLCCADFEEEMVVGSLNNNTIKELWVSKEADDIRKIIVSGKHFETFGICKNCWDLNNAV